MRELELAPSGMRGVIATPRGDLPFTTRLVGRYNGDNLLAAVAAAEALGLPHGAVSAALAAQGAIPGRMERIDRGQPFPVFVDYAHTDAALEAALRSARELQGTQAVAVVFGCGGDRDPGKRPLMGRVAGELADLPIATSDNPRSEDPLAILAAVEQGLKASGNRRYRLVPDRREAIRAAIDEAGPGWSVLVAGKGHEREQIVGDKKLPFSDFEEVEQALERRFGKANPG
jgi:UDP-N-acetylmuramoyl-L-alanyl-D-glutamate--2,6-diaminopimelate ligase